MSQRLSTISVVALTFLYCSCNSIANYDFEKELEAIKKLEKQNNEKTLTAPWDTIPAPLEWIKNREGTGPYTPTDPNYFYVGDNPDYKNGNEYSYYAHFYWSGFPGEGQDGYPHLASNYMLQIQWRFGDSGEWHYINAPENRYGLIGIRYTDVLKDISAYAFPYCDWSGDLRIRMRAIHKDFLTSIPDLEAQGDTEEIYDRSLVSPWSSYWGTTVPNYYNYWGFGQPQPEPHEGGWSNADPNEVVDGQILVTVNLPNLPGYTFSYEISNLSGNYGQVFRDNHPDIYGINKHKMMGVGFTGGTITIWAKCRNTSTGDITYSEKMLNYSLSEKTLEVFFSEQEFLH